VTLVLREAWAGLLRNRTRSLLSMLGISWGIVSVVVLLAYGEGFKQALLRGFRGAFGDGVSINFPGQTSRQAFRLSARVASRTTPATNSIVIGRLLKRPETAKHSGMTASSSEAVQICHEAGWART